MVGQGLWKIVAEEVGLGGGGRVAEGEIWVGTKWGRCLCGAGVDGEAARTDS